MGDAACHVANCGNRKISSSVPFGLYVDRAVDGWGDRSVAPTLTRHIWSRRVVFGVVPSQSEPWLLRMILIFLAVADL